MAEVHEIKFDGGSLVFYDKQGEDFYNIQEDWLDEKMANGMSEWIHQLSGKSWATQSVLVEVAGIIKEKFPDNDINWEITNKIIASQR